MMTTLAERKARAQSGADLPRDTFTLTFLSGEALFDEMRALTHEVEALQIRVAKAEREIEAETDTPKVRKGADGDTPANRKAAAEARIEQAKARVAAIFDEELSEHQEDALLIGMDSGEWQLWRERHPPRITGYKQIVRTAPDGSEITEQGDPIYHDDDVELTKMPWAAKPSCDASAVAEKLIDRFLKKVGDEDLAEGGWSEWVAAAVLWSDRRAIVRAIVSLHERSLVRLPKVQSSPPTPSPSDSTG